MAGVAERVAHGGDVVLGEHVHRAGRHVALPHRAAQLVQVEPRGGPMVVVGEPERHHDLGLVGGDREQGELGSAGAQTVGA